MKKLKSIFREKRLIFSIFAGIAILVLSTNKQFLCLVEKAVEIKFSPADIQSWWELLLKVCL